uniref:Uncharacterized protein n=1 Tax=Arundo donax TaxID=35708 RepID=A0A0A9BL63_ARUDO
MLAIDLLQLVSETGLTSFTRIANSIGNFEFHAHFDRFGFTA